MSRKAISKDIKIDLESIRGINCEICQQIHYDDIHHIDGDPTNNDLDNLRLLCVKCHRTKMWEFESYSSQPIKHRLWLDDMRSFYAGKVWINVSLEVYTDVLDEVKKYSVSRNISKEKAIAELIDKGLCAAYYETALY
jgi:hypothetical protein